MRESETSDVTVILSERVRIRHVGMFQIVVDTSHPRNSLHTTQHHMVSNEWFASTRGKRNSTLAIVALKRRPGIALVATSAGTAYVFDT